MKLKFSRHIFYILVVTLFASTAEAKCDFSGNVGWTIIYSGTVTGYINEDGEKESSFKGCLSGRELIVDDSKSVQCTSYGYSYAYRPDIMILRKQLEMDGKKHTLYEACIDGDMYNIRMD